MKLQFAIKLTAFIASVVSLSWFFAGWRQIHESSALSGWLMLASGIITTLLLLTVQGYWIYFDEKSKGKLVKKIALYEKIHMALNKAEQI